MKTLKVVSFAKIYPYANEKINLVVLYLCALISLLMGLAGICLPFYSELNVAESIQLVMGGLFFLSFATLFLYFCIKGDSDYVPGKSFRWSRITRDGQMKLSIWSVVLMGLLSIYLFICGRWGGLAQSLGALVLIYYFINSLKIHEDVDYVTNQAMEEMLGVDIDEKVCASYQNFDNTRKKQRKGDNLFVVTNRKVFYATYNGTSWMILKRQLQELKKIGWVGSAHSAGKSKLYLEFIDNSSVCIRMDMMEKLTSNPSLFFKQFLNVLDAYVSGYDLVKNNSRRRVSVTPITNNTAKTEEMNTYTQTANNARKVNLELSESVIAQIKTGDEITGGRKIEL
ncbi:MAG: hypothetical protein IJX41_06915 [Bacteroidaceae bacterium]|nr:hypothetical protein [Bacteroidaceae bacterium]